MTPETLIIILVITICITAVLMVNRIFRSTPDRDYAARERDLGLAKLFTARASVLDAESRERNRRMDDRIVLRREQVCDDVRDARGSS